MHDRHWPISSLASSLACSKYARSSLADRLVGKLVGVLQICKLVGEFVNEFVGEFVNEFVGEFFNEFVGEFVNEFVGEFVNEFVYNLVEKMAASLMACLRAGWH